MKQRTFVFLKPDAVKRNLIGEIIKRFEDRGLVVTVLEMVSPAQEIIDQHYPLDNRDYILTLGHVDISGKSPEEIEAIYQKNYNIVAKLQEYVMSGRIVKMILEAEDAVTLVREIVGKTNPASSPKGSIRGDLGEDSFEAADKEGRSVQNLVHASGTPEEAESEITLWFPK
ncbi:MAG: nucleoside-diphosphate kinase [Candidatus Daviesbacteria bacterium]|nr:nucleoside-diphosphate kinase [Candidatus Daviesbacteria bacterium]